MKIVLDTIPIIHSNGADRRTTYNLYRALLQDDLENEYSFLCIDRKKREKRYSGLLEEKPVAVFKVPLPVRTLAWAWSNLNWPKLENLASAADLYHVAGIMAPPTQKAKVLVTIRGIVAEVIPELIQMDKVRSLKKVLRQAMEKADYYLSVSEATKQDMVTFLGINPDAIFVCPHGVDPIFRILPDRKTLFKILKTRFRVVNRYILYVGAIGHHKNIKGILKAYCILRKMGLKSHDLLLVGPPDSAWHYSKSFIDRHNLRHHVHLLGYLQQETDDLTYLYNGADCFVFPSYYEGWCSPPMEAMACGTPVIASNRSSIPETVGDAASLIDPDEPEEISGQIQLVLQNHDLRNQLIEKGLRRTSQLNWKDSALRLIDIYKTIERQK